MRFPILFLSHGAGPCFFLDGTVHRQFADIDKYSQAAAFFNSIPNLLPAKPRAIVCISAHWEAPTFMVGCNSGKEKLIYDYYGFPPEAYAPSVTYDCPTDPALANQIVNMLKEAGESSSVATRGFDHGVFVPLKQAFPEAEIPIVQVSLKSSLDPAAHIKLGKVLSALREDNVLIVCSGSTTHRMNANPGDEVKVRAFEQWLLQTLTTANPNNADETVDQIASMMHIAPHASYLHPRAEHLIPLHVAVGAAYPFAHQVKRIYSQLVFQNLLLDCYLLD